MHSNRIHQNTCDYIVLTGVIIFVALFFFSIPPARAQKPELIIKDYIKYIGGENNWKKVKTMTTSGEYDYGGISFPFNTFAKAPNRYKFIVTSGGKYYAQGFDGKSGWRIDTFKNETTPTTMIGAEATAMANEADVEMIDKLVSYKTNGDKLTYDGIDSVNSMPCYRLRLTRNNGTMETLYFDTRSSELRMREAVSKNAELQKAILKIYYSDYRDIGGIKIPFKTACVADQQVILTIVISKATLDVPIDDKEFQP